MDFSPSHHIIFDLARGLRRERTRRISIMTSSLFLTLLITWLPTNTPGPCPPPTPTPCVTVVVTCDCGAACGVQNPCAPAPRPVCPPAAPPAAAPTPEAPPEIQLTRPKPSAPAPRLDAGATELALFTTARTLPRGGTLLEMTALGVPGELPEGFIDVIGMKIGLTDRAQLGFRTSFRMLHEFEEKPGVQLLLLLAGLNFKYRLWSDGVHSVALNYVFPYTELIWSSHADGNSFTFAAGTSLATWFRMAEEYEPHDLFVRAGGSWRLSKSMRFVAEAGMYMMEFEDPDTVLFTSAGLRFGGRHAYLDVFVSAVGIPGHGGGPVGGVTLGWQP
jgi:hypothetical protein